jgi:hypothetical protein
MNIEISVGHVLTLFQLFVLVICSSQARSDGGRVRVALRINNDRGRAGLVSQQVGSVRQAGQIVL